MVNKSMFLGNLGSDPKSFNYKNKIGCKLSIAVSEKDKNGNQKTDWVEVTVFSEATSKSCLKYLKKGDRIFAECKFKTNNYELKGVKHYSFSFIANNIVFLNKRKAEKKQEAKLDDDPGWETQSVMDDPPF